MFSFEPPPFLSYPRVAEHRVLGDRRTALFAEEHDPRTQDPIGNHPPLFTHTEGVAATWFERRLG